MFPKFLKQLFIKILMNFRWLQIHKLGPTRPWEMSSRTQNPDLETAARTYLKGAQFEVQSSKRV